ncbi:hypothetical protein ONZ45_g2961 [Pleurotus djamor]|nr:hypothetical protein ONZ45_g2961 [Pleurotus djamor]
MDPHSFVRVHFPPILERNLYLPAKYASRLLLLLLGLTLWSAIILVNASDAYAQVATNTSFLILFLGATLPVFAGVLHRNEFWSDRLDDTILLWMDIAGFIKEFAEVLIDTPELPPSVQEPILFHLRDLVNSLGLTCGDRSKLSNNPITRQANANHRTHQAVSTLLVPLDAFKQFLSFLGHAFPCSGGSPSDEAVVPRQAWIELYMLILRMEDIHDIDKTTAKRLLHPVDELRAHAESFPQLNSYPDPLAFVPDMLDHTSKRFAWNVDIHNLPNTAI